MKLITEEALAAFEEKLTDRFGKIPPPAEALAGYSKNKVDGL